jgi:hypothetical protein
MRLPSLLLLVVPFTLPACLEDHCTPEDPCYDVTTISYHANPVAVTSAAGRFVAYDDHSFTIRGALLGDHPTPLGGGDSLAIASDGSDHVLLVRDRGRLLSRRVSDGTSHVIATDAYVMSPPAASIVFAHDGYWAAWRPEGFGAGTGLVARLARSGELVGGPWQVSSTKVVDRGLSIAADATGAIVVWTETHEAAVPELHVRRIANDGTLGPDHVRARALAGAIIAGDGGFVLASITDSSIVIAEHLDGELAPVGPPITIAGAYDDVGAEPEVAVAGRPGAFAVQYTSAHGSINGIPGWRRPYAKVVLGDSIGARIDLGSTPGRAQAALLTGYDGVFHSLWNEYRTVTTGPESYDQYFDLSQATLHPDGATIEQIF